MAKTKEKSENIPKGSTLIWGLYDAPPSTSTPLAITTTFVFLLFPSPNTALLSTPEKLIILFNVYNKQWGVVVKITIQNNNCSIHSKKIKPRELKFSVHKKSRGKRQKMTIDECNSTTRVWNKIAARVSLTKKSAKKMK